jgi:glycosyltransferase involved in cell wall biosynthesis
MASVFLVVSVDGRDKENLSENQRKYIFDGMMEASSGKKVLMVFPFFPYPLRVNGVSVRYLPVIKFLSERHSVDIIVIANDIEDVGGISGLENYCNKLMIVRRQKINKTFLNKIKIHIISLLPWTPPIAYINYSGEIIPNEIEKNVKGFHYDTLLWITCYFSPYLSPTLNLINADRVVMDFIDSPTLLEERTYRQPSKYYLRGRYKCWKTRKWEKKITNEVNATIYISAVDAGTVPSKLVLEGKRYVINNVLDVASYDPDLKTNLPSPNIGFLGHMSYPPNVEAVHWLFDNIFLPLRRNMPDLSLIIIGRNPSNSIVELGKNKGVIVTGTVDDIWPYINSVDVFVFPIWTGAGIKNKVIEAMYSKRPVVTTEIGNEGIEARSNQHLIVCRDKEDFCKQVELLLCCREKRNRLGEAAYEYVKNKFLLKNTLKKFEEVIFQ